MEVISTNDILQATNVERVRMLIKIIEGQAVYLQL